MPLDRRSLRLLFLLLAAVQLVLPGAAMVAEAHLVAAEGPIAHVEEDDTSCLYVGHAEQCALCQFLRTHAEEASPSLPAFAAAERRDAPAERSTRVPRASPSLFPLPRSPPSRA